ncbi:unnamed protein product [Heligmosomoides polygyrus]|uniref:DUF5641 domain-containing protein n=1 Tax=Heligmosomoides polygyrus TaxID=6339 RepID=A0A183F9H9_HELPZ|nr:unnamed protein product [Heligmosomoides polygyrus]
MKIAKNIAGFNTNIPRFIASKSTCRYDLIVISDASRRVYAAVAYLACRPLNSKPFSNIIYAKTRIATPEKSTVPRLELQAIVLAAKMTRFLLKELTIRVHSIHWLSDSQIALYWIHSKKQLKTFVQNRVKLIHETISDHFKFVRNTIRTKKSGLEHLGTPSETVTTKDPFSSSDSQEHLIYQYSSLRESLNTFWDIWHKEYLRAIAERNQIRLAKRQSSSKQPQIGDIVLIEMDNTGRSQWPLGVVVELNKSLDGAIRSVKVRTAKRHVLDRSTNQLIPLEVAAKKIVQRRSTHLHLPPKFSRHEQLRKQSSDNFIYTRLRRSNQPIFNHFLP